MSPRAAALRLLVAGALVLLAACAPSDPGEALLEDYRSRVARTLSGDPGTVPEVQLAPWPRARERVLEVPSRRVDLIEFLRLQDCGLGALVGGRSSSLGRVMQASERLRYELEFIATTEHCLASFTGDDDAEVRAWLVDVLAQKQTQLPAVIWNATLGSEALARTHALDVEGLDPRAVAGAGSDATGALHGLAERARGAVAPSDGAWFDPWSRLEASRFGGRLRRSLAQLTVHLDEVAMRLESHGALCPGGRVSERARILENLFWRYYAERVQPHLAAVDRAGAAWLAALEDVRSAQRTAPPAAFVDNPVAVEFARMRAARDRHTRIWQDVLGACGMAPSARDGAPAP